MRRRRAKLETPRLGKRILNGAADLIVELPLQSTLGDIEDVPTDQRVESHGGPAEKRSVRCAHEPVPSPSLVQIEDFAAEVLERPLRLHRAAQHAIAEHVAEVESDRAGQTDPERTRRDSQ